MKHTLLTLAFATMLFVGPVQAQDHMKNADDCSKVCATCQLACEKNFHHCAKLVTEGRKEHAKAAQLSLDCAEFCTISARLTARHSPLMMEACEACAKACDMCAKECEKFDSPEMEACAKQCRECEASCREMVKHHMHKSH